MKLNHYHKFVYISTPKVATFTIGEILKTHYSRGLEDCGLHINQIPTSSLNIFVGQFVGTHIHGLFPCGGQVVDYILRIFMVSGKVVVLQIILHSSLTGYQELNWKTGMN